MKTDQTTTIEDLRALMRQFVAERDWQKFHNPRNIAASVCVEAGELLEHFQWVDNAVAMERLKTDPAYKKAVGEEFADVLMYLMSLANALEIDVSQTVHAKMARNRTKYPPEEFKGKYQRPLE